MEMVDMEILFSTLVADMATNGKSYEQIYATLNSVLESAIQEHMDEHERQQL